MTSAKRNAREQRLAARSEHTDCRQEQSLGVSSARIGLCRISGRAARCPFQSLPRFRATFECTFALMWPAPFRSKLIRSKPLAGILEGAVMATTARVASLGRWAFRWAPWVASALSGAAAGALNRTGSDVGTMGAPAHPDHHAFGR